MVRWCGEDTAHSWTLGHQPRHRQTPLGSCWARVGCGAAEGSTAAIHRYSLNILWRVSLFQSRQGPGLSNVL